MSAALISLFGLVPSSVQRTAHAAGGLAWNTGVTTGPISLARPAVALGQDGNVYVFGGTLGDDTDYNTTFIYQPGTNSWSLGAPMPVAREGAQAITLPDGRIAVLGGATGCAYNNLCSNGIVYSRVDVYTPSTDTWSSLAAMQSPRYRFAAVWYQRALYVIGGSDGTQALASVERYDTSANTWSVSASLPQATEAPNAVVDPQGHIDVFGGFDGGPLSDTYSAFWSYDGTAWSSGPMLPQAESDGSATVGSDGQIYVAGGFDHYLGWLTTVQVYDPVQNTWALGTPLPSPTCCSGIVTVPGGQIYVVNGGVSAGAQFAVYGPTIALAPAAGAAGSTVTFTGAGFTPSATVRMYWGTAGSRQLLATGVADGNGTTTPISFTVPVTASPGSYTVTAVDDQSHYPVMTTFVVPTSQPSIAALSTAGGNPGQGVAATGDNFAPGEAVGLYWDRTSAPVAATVSGGNGAFKAAFRVPATASGSHYLLAVGLRSHRWSYRRFVVRPRSVVAHPSATSGMPNTIYLWGFPAHKTVAIYWRSPGGVPLGSVMTNGVGSATLSFTVPSATPGSYNVLSAGGPVGGIATETLTP